MQQTSSFSRRQFVATTAGLAAGSLLAGPGFAAAARPAPPAGRLKQGVCRGVFRGLNLEMDGMCREAARLGAVGFDLVGPEAFPALKKYGLVPTMVPGGSAIKAGINDRQHHATIEPKMREAIRAAAAAGAPNVIVLAGDRAGISDAQGMDNCAAFLDGIKRQAEDAGVTLCMELLNSKVNHPGYMCDRTAWGVELVKRVGSPRFKLLYDIYHMQIMEGDIIRTLRENIAHFAHIHTAGNPGRHEFDETQEINYPPIFRALVELKFEGYVSHEYTPTKDPLGTLEKMIALGRV